MNIKITYKWLLEYLETDADPYEMQKYLSLCGPSIERVDKVEDDYVFDIEVTSNRVDMASVFGVAQEAQSILPQFGKKATLKLNPTTEYVFSKIASVSQSAPLDIKIESDDLCSRFTAIILSNVKIGNSPDFIKKRLELCDVNSINNVIDISNYLMLSLGQPTHTFDYDKIANHLMIMRESKKKEVLRTLDGKKIVLPGGDIVIEDGSKKLIDLCGIMGGENSMITQDTKNILLFVQTYNKRKIRRTSMTTGQRSVAATYFEKGLDEERVEPTIVYGTELLQKFAGGSVGSKVYDIYPHPYTPKTITIMMTDITRVMGIELLEKTVTSILENLGFTVETPHDASLQQFIITIPSWRKDDINIKEDIIEEVARVYGYHRLPDTIQSSNYVKQPPEIESLFSLQQKIKHFLKHLGLHESMNYSMVSEQLIKTFEMKPENHLMLANTISEEIKFMRLTLIPSLAKNIKDNIGKKQALRFFEIAKVYYPQNNSLPDEQYKLGIAVNSDFFDLKGIIESILKELHISQYEFQNSSNPLFSSKMQTDLVINGEIAGSLGQIKPLYKKNLLSDIDIYAAEIDFKALIKHHKLLPTYIAPNPYAVIKLDVTTSIKADQSFAQIRNLAKKTSSLLVDVEFVSQYKNNISYRFVFSSRDKNITEEEAKSELEMIKKVI